MNQKTILAILIGISFLLLIGAVVFYVESTTSIRDVDPLELELMDREEIIQYVYEEQARAGVSYYYFIPIFGFFGVTIGAAIFFLLSKETEKIESRAEHSAETILKLLSGEERKVVRKILEGHGRIPQVEITYLEGYTKVKAHRILDSLERKGIVTKEALGKTRIVKLDKELYELLK